MIQSIKIKALLSVCMVHAGLVLAVVAIFREDTAALSSSTSWLLITSVALLYGAYLFSVLAIWIPLQPWISRYRHARAWRTWIIHELPTLLALLPIIVSGLKILSAAWDEIKSHQSKGDLDIGKLAGIAQKFAQDAEKLAQTKDSP